MINCTSHWQESLINQPLIETNDYTVCHKTVENVTANGANEHLLCPLPFINFFVFGMTDAFVKKKEIVFLLRCLTFCCSKGTRIANYRRWHSRLKEWNQKGQRLRWKKILRVLVRNTKITFRTVFCKETRWQILQKRHHGGAKTWKHSTSSFSLPHIWKPVFCYLTLHKWIGNPHK